MPTEPLHNGPVLDVPRIVRQASVTLVPPVPRPHRDAVATSVEEALSSGRRPCIPAYTSTCLPVEVLQSAVITHHYASESPDKAR